MAPFNGAAISIHVKVFVDPAKVDEFLKEIRPIFESITAEPECIFFEVLQSSERPGEFKIVEHWNASMEWMKTVQMNKEYYKPFMSMGETFFTKEKELEFWERIPGNKWIATRPELTAREE